MANPVLAAPQFQTEEGAFEYVESRLWPQGPVCPRCGVMGDRITKMAGKSLRPGVYNCKDCRKPFTPEFTSQKSCLTCIEIHQNHKGA